MEHVLRVQILTVQHHHERDAGDEHRLQAGLGRTTRPKLAGKKRKRANADNRSQQDLRNTVRMDTTREMPMAATNAAPETMTPRASIL